MPSPFTSISDLLTTVPLTTITEEAEYSEIALATVARALHGATTDVTLPVRKEFVSNFLTSMQPWLPTTKEGRMSKRIAAYMWKAHKTSVEPKLIETIGTYLGQNAPAGAWMFDITNRLNWKAGDFGDRDACFLKDRRYVLDAMMEDGCTAIRFYEQLEKPLGAGRAWIAPSNQGPVVFNAYGPHLDLVGGRIAQLLPGVPMSLVKLTNQGSSMGSLYINQAVAILVGSAGVTDVNIEILTGHNRPIRCANCAERIAPHSLYNVQDDDDNAIRICRSCFDSYWAQDFFSGSYRRKEKMEEVECVVQGRVSDDGYEYEGLLQKVWVLPDNVDELNHCDKCGRLCNGMLYISVDGKSERWCYLCAHETKLECRYCSWYLPEGESVCQCGRTTFKRRDERWA